MSLVKASIERGKLTEAIGSPCLGLAFLVLWLESIGFLVHKSSLLAVSR
jgi:hypothetical protein